MKVLPLSFKEAETSVQKSMGPMHKCLRQFEEFFKQESFGNPSKTPITVELNSCASTLFSEGYIAFFPHLSHLSLQMIDKCHSPHALS